MIRKSSDGAALVDTDHTMVDVTEVPAPKNILLICGNIQSGKAVISHWDDKFGFTHWAPLPVFDK